MIFFFFAGRTNPMLIRLPKNSSSYISFSRSTTVEEYHHIGRIYTRDELSV